MLKRILSALGVGSGAAPSVEPTKANPYTDKSTSLIYHLLFCDQPQLFKDNHKGELVPPWTVLFNDTPDYQALARIAEDEEQESRVRMLAFHALKVAGKPVPQKTHLGTIIEVRLPNGLDTLAVFVDGGLRYINQSGKIAVVEGVPNPFEEEIKQVLDASKSVVAAIGPWEKDRLPAPKRGNIRVSFLVSDGLYFGEGPMKAMQKDQLAAPLIASATKLLLKLVEKATSKNGDGRSIKD
jgi:hypothetical protein